MYFDYHVIIEYLPFLLGGLVVTFKLAGLALAGGIFFGMLVGLGRISEKNWIYYPVSAYVNFLRNIPLIIIIFWVYFILPIIVGRSMNPFISSVIAFIIFEATYFGEIFRAGYQSISKDMVGSAYATGLTYWQVARYVTIPIAFRRMLPSLITQSIITFQDTSLAFVIGLHEFVTRANVVNNLEYRSIEIYSFVAVIFLIICFIGSRISLHFETKYRKANVL